MTEHSLTVPKATRFATFNPQKLIGALLVFFGAITHSSKAIFIKLAYQYPIDPVSLVALRMLFALPFFLVIGYLSGRSKTANKLTPRDWVAVAFLGFVSYYFAALLDFMGLQYITASLERLILFVYPTIVVIISATIYRKKVTRPQLIALGFTYLGVAVVFAGSLDMAQQKNFILGVLLVFGCAVFYAIYMIGSEKLIPKVGATRFTAYAMTFAAMGVISHYFINNSGSLLQFPRQVYELSIGMAIISTVVPAFLVSAGIKRIGASDASIVASVGPIATIVMAYIFLNESLSGTQLLGTALVLGGVLLISLRKKKKSDK